MRSRTEVRVGAGGVVHRLDCRPPLTVRQVHSEDRCAAALCLVGTAAGPLAGDDLELVLDLDAGARASLTASGASLAQGGASRYCTTVGLGAGATLCGRPGALIASEGSHVDVTLRIALGADATLDWRETVVLGRSGQLAGTATLRWDVTRCDRPVLRQDVDLRERTWRGVLDGRRVLATALLTGAHIAARTVVRSPHAVAARLDEHTVLATVLACDAATAGHELDELCATFSAGARSGQR